MPARRGNRSKRRVENRAKVKRVTAAHKRRRSMKRKRRDKRGPR